MKDGDKLSTPFYSARPKKRKEKKEFFKMTVKNEGTEKALHLKRQP